MFSHYKQLLYILISLMRFLNREVGFISIKACDNRLFILTYKYYKNFGDVSPFSTRGFPSLK
jgi:hypothetical protein